MRAALRRRHDMALRFNRPRAHQHMPMRLAGRYGEGGGNREDRRAAIGQRPIKLGKPQVVTDAETHPTKRRFDDRSEEHTSELQSLMRISYAVFCLKKKKQNNKRK